jgi:hypothetical protein
MPARLLYLTALLLVVAAVGATSVHADLFPGDDSFAQAKGPLGFGTTYSGALRTSDDLDYESFDIAKAGQALHITVRNTQGKCTNPDKTGCPIYATLLDRNEKQVGGEGSSAGTGKVDAGTTQYIDWKFAEAGRYVIVVESGSDTPTYSLRLDRVAAGPVFQSVRVPSSQRGTAVRGRVVFGRAISQLRADVVGSRGALYGRLVRRSLAARGHALRVNLNSRGRAALAKAGRLRVALRLVAKPVDGATATATRRVVLGS